LLMLTPRRRSAERRVQQESGAEVEGSEWVGGRGDEQFITWSRVRACSTKLGQMSVLWPTECAATPSVVYFPTCRHSAINISTAVSFSFTVLNKMKFNCRTDWTVNSTVYYFVKSHANLVALQEI
jgi:hypothetical protein